MSRSQRVRVVTRDPERFEACRRALGAEPGLEVTGPSEPPAPGAPAEADLLLVDAAWPEGDVYALLRRLAGSAGARLALLVDDPDPDVDAIARFCGATAVLPTGFDGATVATLLGAGAARPPELDGEPQLPEALLRELSSGAASSGRNRPAQLLESLADPETSLFNYEFLTYKLDEEFKRSRRFGLPLACVMAGFEGQADEATLRELASLFLQASRDTDILGRFDESSFLFLLPLTPPQGAEVMAKRIQRAVAEKGLRDLVGDPLVLAVGIAHAPHPEVRVSDDLYRVSRELYRRAERAGGGVLQAT